MAVCPLVLSALPGASYRAQCMACALQLTRFGRYAALLPGRMASRARDPNVFVIFIALRPPSDAMLAYYDRVVDGILGPNMQPPDPEVELDGDAQTRRRTSNSGPGGDVAGETPSASEEESTQLNARPRRYHVLSPENTMHFPETLPLTDILLYSPHCLRELTALIRGRPSYIVPGVVGPSEKRLCALLGVPMLANDPNTGWGFSNKIRARAVFKACDVAIASGTHLLPQSRGETDQLRVEQFDKVKKHVMKLSASGEYSVRARNTISKAVAHLTTLWLLCQGNGPPTMTYQASPASWHPTYVSIWSR